MASSFSSILLHILNVIFVLLYAGTSYPLLEVGAKTPFLSWYFVSLLVDFLSIITSICLSNALKLEQAEPAMKTLARLKLNGPRALGALCPAPPLHPKYLAKC
mgnify:CR=1 FL=1